MSKKYPTKDDGSPKGLSFGKKIEWVWNYYKGVIIGVIVGVAAIVYFIYCDLIIKDIPSINTKTQTTAPIVAFIKCICLLSIVPNDTSIDRCKVSTEAAISA